MVLPARRSEEKERHGSPQQQQQHSSASAQKRPIIAQQHSGTATSSTKVRNSSRPNTPPSALKGTASPPNFPQPLLADVSLYTNAYSSFESEGTTLEELAHLVRLSKYQERKRANTRIRLQRSLVATALSARLTRCGEITQRNLAECFRNEDKKAFSNLFSAIHDVRNSCDATRRFALLEPDMDALQSPGMTSSEGLETPTSVAGSISPNSSVAPFLNDISASAREAFLNFLTQLRTNPDYLATRLCSLNSLELQALTTFHHGLDPIESVLPYFSSRPSGRGGHGSSANRNPGHTPNAIERLLSFQRHDPLSALIYTCFANSAGPDSAEDRRRTDIWANACARLISEAKSNSAREPILTSVLNVWSSMRDWSGRSNMEWFLMKILEDGAFLLDRAEDQNGTRFNISEWTHKDNVAADEFYDRAINELFEIIDDEDATGIPEGLVELGNEILRRLDSGFVESTKRWFVCKWLFSHWLIAVVVHPESYGMMSEYHITEYGRQKILKQVAQRAQQLVIDMTWNTPKKPVSTPPKVKGHIENILGRFKPSRAQKTTRLLPARSITSLRETVEVHPYLVISPADLLTLVNALFPERRPQSAHSGSIRSGAPSISGFSTASQPISVGTSRSNFDTASVISMSASSVMSDATTSREPLLEDQVPGTPQRYSPPVHDAASQKHLSNYEEDGYRLRLAMHEMVQILGADVVSGSCHPCAERWAVLFISANGNSLSMQMTYDPDDDPDEENSSTTSDTEDDDPEDRPELDKDYHQLRDSILKLVEDFEIPRGLEDDGAKTTFSNRASGLKKYKSKSKIITTESSMASRNPYRRRDEEDRASKQRMGSPARQSAMGKGSEGSEPPSVLMAMLEAASSQSRVQADFVSAHLYWKTLQQLNALASPSLRKNGFATLLNIFSRGPRDSIRRSASAIEEYDAWLVWLKQSQERHEGLIESMMKRLRAIRDKMWYVTDVHNSAPYEHTRSICSALKIMGVPRRWGTFQRTRAQLSRGPAANYLYKNESQMLDLLAASEEQGGPNKLSDDQAEKTAKWLEQLGVENFCKGEERIHRFCCEVESCIGKLVGESIIDGPVLWASELYLRDRKALEGTKPTSATAKDRDRDRDRDRDSYWGGEDSFSVVSDPERRYAMSMSSSSRPNSIARDFRAMTTHNVSQLSVDSRYNFSRASTTMSDILDAGDYFGVASPVHAIDSSTTFWSPFQSTMPSTSSVTSRAQSPTTSITNLSCFSYPQHRQLPPQPSGGRPGTSTSSNETIHLQRLSEEKQRFLDELRQTLTSLLLSDLGNHVFSGGSETDAWFKDLGQDCIDRREAHERQARRLVVKKDRTRTSKSSTRHRVIEKKKSFGNLRGAGESVDAEHLESQAAQSNDSSATTSDNIPARSRQSSKDEPPEFPYKKAYQRLLRMFCVHPNPHMKMNALFELKHLIVASLSSGGRRSRWSLRNQLSPHEDDSTGAGNMNALDQTVDSVKERRSHAFQAPLLAPPSRSAANADARSMVSVNPANTDAIVNILQTLFRDAGIRPKTLFRDLQFIASFVPASQLDKSEKGKAFWDAGLAALSLKQDVCRTMVEVADEIVKVHTQPRKPSGGGEENPDSPLRSPPPPQLGDAARMWTITAKEGDPTAQRELALFNLSNPELVERTTLPLSKPREVFKQAVMEKYGARPGSSARHPGERLSRSVTQLSLGSGGVGQEGTGSGKDSDVRNDPALMCVAIHWMEAAEQGGDELAKTFLRQNEMMGLS
ncbi:uncharacterized protein BCR38DRAFT_330118 [Pseudomassariella vexata]|uniref:Uncharacterized protein n=1 Tax=Pseudomassariella vexata TaxID=1141098 RepID=A0A1Y2EKU5_9PEZI|nr:uncharacterized protein BCR38DRAFT_330118 [Pseudomassariella vexata]ORY72173.1 hypothetical protein BCR38DRAFT_330118 [Pseudomassariella vexata]